MEKRKLVNTWLKGDETCSETYSLYPHRHTCISICKLNSALKLCKCASPFDESLLQFHGSLNHLDTSEVHKVCSPMQTYECIRCFGDKLDEHRQECRKKCLQPCTSISYRQSYSTMSFSDGIRSNNNSHIMLQILFESFDITVTEEIITVTIPSVLANVGGAMGVFIGASMISLVELIGYMAQCFAAKFSVEIKP